MNGFQIGSKRLKVQHKRTSDGSEYAQAQDQMVGSHLPPSVFPPSGPPGMAVFAGVSGQTGGGTNVFEQGGFL